MLLKQFILWNNHRLECDAVPSDRKLVVILNKVKASTFITENPNGP
jgi:hypothetical protein